MKKIIILNLLLIFSVNLFSQSSEFDICILLQGKAKIFKISNDSIIYQQFNLEEQIQYLKQDLQFNENGILETNIIVPGINKDFYLRFIYKNEKDKNLPIIIKKEEAKNILVYPKDFKNIKIEKFRKLLSKANDIYIIESDSVFGFYILKKVILEKKLPGF